MSASFYWPTEIVNTYDRFRRGSDETRQRSSRPEELRDGGSVNEVTSVFYTHVVDASGGLDHMRAAFALRKTMRSVNIPVSQRVLDIHLGA